MVLLYDKIVYFYINYLFNLTAMALEKVLEVYLNNGESSEVVDKLKEMGVCLESFFNRVQLLKAEHKSKVFFKDIHKAIGSAAFDGAGNLHTNFNGPHIKVIYSYLDPEGAEQTTFVLL